MALRLIHDPEEAAETGTDPRDPSLYRSGLSSARAELRRGVARRHEREIRSLETDRSVDLSGLDEHDDDDHDEHDGEELSDA